MKSRLARVGLVAAGLLALLGTTTPAQADTAFAAAFVGQANLTGGGLGYPIVTLPNDTPPLPPTTHCALPLNGTYAAIPNCHLQFGNDHTRGITGGSTNCVGASVNVNKTNGLPPANAGICGFAIGSGSVTGHCGLSGGQATGTITDGHSVFAYNVHFTGIASVLYVTGHYRKTTDSTNHGKLIAVLNATPIPQLLVLPTPPTHIFNNSCSNKTASVFTLVGVAVGLPDPQL